MNIVSRPIGFDKRIKDGYAADEPVKSIAADLGVTKAVVTGRAHILGLSDPARVTRARSRELKRRHEDPVKHAAMMERALAGARRYFADADNKSEHSALVKAFAAPYWSDPEAKAAHIAKLHAGRDEFNRKRSSGL